MITVRKLLQAKPECIWTIRLEETAYDALQLMADNDIGALMVVDEENELVGVFSERDYARKVILKGKSSRSTSVGELMTQAVYYVGLQQTIDECMALMSGKHIRHLPVIEQGKLIGVVTIGDVVKMIISEQEVTIRDLETYITGASYETAKV
jgi:CBS domain-containing protein